LWIADLRGSGFASGHEARDFLRLGNRFAVVAE